MTYTMENMYTKRLKRLKNLDLSKQTKSFPVLSQAPIYKKYQDCQLCQEKKFLAICMRVLGMGVGDRRDLKVTKHNLFIHVTKNGNVSW